MRISTLRADLYYPSELGTGYRNGGSSSGTADPEPGHAGKGHVSRGLGVEGATAWY